MTISPADLDRLITDPPLTPTAHHLLVVVDEVSDVTEGGIALPTKMVEREQHGAASGWIIACGPYVWQEDDEPWARVGDQVVFKRYAGTVPPIDGLDDGRFRIMNDEEVIALCPKRK